MSEQEKDKHKDTSFLVEKKNEDDLLRRVFMRVSKGYSVGEYEGSRVYIKHTTALDQDYLDGIRTKRLKSLENKGIPCREERLKQLHEEDVWTHRDDEKIAQAESFLKNLEVTKNNLVLPSQIEQMEKKIVEAKAEIAARKQDRESLLTDTREAYVDRYISDETLFMAFFKDAELTTPFFKREEFDDIERMEMYKLVQAYNISFENLSLTNIKKCALSNMFTSYYQLCEDEPYKLFDRKPLELSYYQLNLLSYGRVFKSILKNIPDIPDEIRDDAEKLLIFAESGHEKEQKIKELQGKGKNIETKKTAQSVVGASKEDLDKMGYNQENVMTPLEMMRKQGKTNLSLLGGDF